MAIGGPLRSLLADRVSQSAIGVYTGDVELTDGGVRVLPWKRFLQALSAGDLLS